MGKSTEPPTCRFCGKAHRGTCMDHEARGAISSQLDVSAAVARVATMSSAEVIAASKERKKRITAASKAVKPGRVGKLVKPPAEQERSSAPGSLPVVSVEGLDPHGGSNPPPIPTKSKRVSTTITDGRVSHTAINVPITAAELGIAPKKRKPRMTNPTDKPAKPGRGRPKTKTPEERKAYLAQKAKERRAKQKAKP